MPILEQLSQDLVLEGLKPSSARTYSSQQGVFLRFCRDLNLTPVPCDSSTILWFITWLNKIRGVGPASVKGYLAAINHLHMLNGFQFNAKDDPRVCLAKKGASKRSVKKDVRLPITLDILTRMFEDEASRGKSYDSYLFLAGAALAYHGWLRISELCGDEHQKGKPGLRLENLERREPGLLILHLLDTKTDKDQSGRQVEIVAGTDGTCALAALDNYTFARQKTSQSTRLLIHKDGKDVEASWFRAYVKSACARQGLCGLYNTHSFRIGAASDAAASGMPQHLIKLRGRWSSEAYLSYLRPTPQEVGTEAKRYEEITRARNEGASGRSLEKGGRVVHSLALGYGF